MGQTMSIQFILLIFLCVFFLFDSLPKIIIKKFNHNLHAIFRKFVRFVLRNTAHEKFTVGRTFSKVPNIYYSQSSLKENHLHSQRYSNKTDLIIWSAIILYA